MKIRLGVLATHPIQYHAPLFRQLARSSDINLTVYFAHKPTPVEQGVGFGVPFLWDVDLTSGYEPIWLKNTSEIRTIIGKEKFDMFLVLGWNNRCYWEAMTACWKQGVPVCVRGDSHLHKQNPPAIKLIKEIAYPLFIRRFSSCLAVGRWSQEYFAHYGARRIILSPHFVDNAWFAAESSKLKPQAAQIRKEWGISPDAVVFLFVGKMLTWKRPMDLLRALKQGIQMNAGGGRFHALMVGDGATRKWCEQFSKENRLPVTFTGFLNQTEMPRAYAAADVLALLSGSEETWGLVANEAMACGLPAIVSDQAGCGPDLIKEGETGFIFRCGDVTGLAGAMRRMAASGETILRMGQAARRHIAGFSIEAAAEGVRQAAGTAGEK